MATVIQITSYYGEDPGTKVKPILSQKYNTKFPTEPDPNPAVPCHLPLPGETYRRSAWVCNGIELISGSFSWVRNFYWFGPGTIKRDWKLGSGQVQIGSAGVPIMAYKQATGMLGEYGYDLSDPEHGHPYFNGEYSLIELVDADAYTPSNSLLFDSGTYNNLGEISNVIYHQLVLADDSETGTKIGIPFGIRWEEM